MRTEGEGHWEHSYGPRGWEVHREEQTLFWFAANSAKDTRRTIAADVASDVGFWTIMDIDRFSISREGNDRHLIAVEPDRFESVRTVLLQRLHVLQQIDLFSHLNTSVSFFGRQVQARRPGPILMLHSS